MPEMAATATILIRFCATTDRAAGCGPTLAFLSAFLPFGRCDVVFTDIVSPELVGQAAQQPDPDAFPVEVCPRSAAIMACYRPRKLKRSGKPKLTATDGL